MTDELDGARAGIVAAGREAIAEIIRAADEATAAVVRVIEQQTGVTLAVQCPSVMDASRAQLTDAERRARYALLAVDLINGWHWPPDVATLGEFVRGLPPEVAEQIADNLVRAEIS